MKLSNACKVLLTSFWIAGCYGRVDASSLAEGPSVSAIEPDDNNDLVKVLVKFSNSDHERALASLRRLVPATRVMHMYSKFGMAEMKIPHSQLESLQQSPHVEFVEVEHKIQFLHPIEDSPKSHGGTRGLGRNLAQSTPWGIDKVLENSGIQPGPHGADIKVCVIDTGYDLGHPDLPPANGTSTEAGTWSSDGHGHGTHCAGTIAALNNNEGVVGVVGNGDGIQMHIGKGLDDGGSGEWGEIMTAFEGCVDAGARIISMSLGCDQSDYDCHSHAFESMITQAYNDFEVLTIAAAGNDGNTALSLPASYEAVMSVAAMTEYEGLASFSQQNYQVEITGPGVGVYSTWKNDGYRYASGTSMATPHVSGVAALLWSYNPSCSAKQIRKILLASARPLGTKTCSTSYGYGLVQAETAVDMLVAGGCDAGEANRSGMLSDEELYVGCRLAAGEICDSDGECDSGKCIFGICRDEGLGAGEACEDHEDCLNGSCARGSYSSDASTVCCPGGGHVELDVPWSWYDQEFCTGLSTGEACGSSAMCSSNMCIFGTCQEERLASNEICEKDADCADAVCAKGTFTEDSPMVCCPKGGHVELDVPWSYRDYEFCTGLGVGEVCGSNTMCSSGICILGTCRDERLVDAETCEEGADCVNRSCARSSYTEDAGLVCCPGGGYVELDVPWSWYDQEFCTGLSTGEACGSNAMCSSNICIFGTCQEERLASNEACEKDTDCVDAVCAKAAFTEDSPKVCCPKGGHVELDVPWSWYDYDFCTGLATGEVCGSNTMCSSGICILGTCRDTRLVDTETCEENADCVNRACARAKFTEDAGLVCCPGGEHVKLDVPWTYYDLEFCTGLPSGEDCGSDSMCNSKACSSGKCA